MGDLVKGILGICGEVVTLGCSPVTGGGCLCGLDTPGTRSCPAAPFARSQEGRFQHLSQTCCSSALAEEGQWKGSASKPAEMLNTESSSAPCLAFQ